MAGPWAGVRVVELTGLTGAYATRLWAALQDIGGGAWGGCVYETEKILKVLEAGKRALGM